MTLRELRLEKGLTMKQVAERAQSSESAVSLYERGLRKMSLQMAARIASVLECKVDDLVACDESGKAG